MVTSNLQTKSYNSRKILFTNIFNNTVRCIFDVPELKQSLNLSTCLRKSAINLCSDINLEEKKAFQNCQVDTCNQVLMISKYIWK